MWPFICRCSASLFTQKKAEVKPLLFSGCGSPPHSVGPQVRCVNLGKCVQGLCARDSLRSPGWHDFYKEKNWQTLRFTGWWLRWIGSSCGARNALCASLTAFRPLRHPLAPFIRHWRRGQGGANDIRIMSATRYAHRAGTIFTKKKLANLTVHRLVVALDWILLRCPKCLVRFAYGISTAAPPPCPFYPPLAAGARGRQRHSDYERDSLRSPGSGILYFLGKKTDRSSDLPVLVVAGAGFEPTTFGL